MNVRRESTGTSAGAGADADNLRGTPDTKLVPLRVRTEFGQALLWAGYEPTIAPIFMPFWEKKTHGKPRSLGAEKRAMIGQNN